MENMIQYFQISSPGLYERVSSTQVHLTNQQREDNEQDLEDFSKISYKMAAFQGWTTGLLGLKIG